MKSIDVYSSPLMFTFYGDSTYTTKFGGMMTILTLLVFIALFFIFSLDTINKTNPILYIQLTYDQDKQTINPVDNKFVNIIFQPFKYNTSNNQVFLFDRSIFNIFFESLTYNNVNKTKDGVNIYKPLEPCDINDFDPSFHSFFNSSGFAYNAFCMQTRDNELYGQYSSPIFKFLKFSLRECQDGVVDSFGPNNLKCKLRNQTLLELQDWRFSVYLTYASAAPSNSQKNYYIQLYNQGLSPVLQNYPKSNYFLERM
jgi:hypothetical protein